MDVGREGEGGEAVGKLAALATALIEQFQHGYACSGCGKTYVRTKY